VQTYHIGTHRPSLETTKRILKEGHLYDCATQRLNATQAFCQLKCAIEKGEQALSKSDVKMLKTLED
jgi:hypothetical protein